MAKAVSHQPRAHDAVKPSLRNPSVRLGGSNVGIRPFPTGPSTRELRVSATDADGLSTQTTVPVEIFMTKSGDDIPPLCKVKPWLPQCK